MSRTIEFILEPKRQGDWLIQISGEAIVTPLGRVYEDNAGAFGPESYDVEFDSCQLYVNDSSVTLPRGLFLEFENDIINECIRLYERGL